MKKISEKTFQKIQKDSINPIPKWHFLVKNNGIWLLAIISALAGSLATAVIIHDILNKDWFIYHSIHHPGLTSFFFDLPIIWLGIFIATVWIAHYNVENSRSGYHYSHYFIVFGSLIFSLVFGILFNIAGLGARIDEAIPKAFPFYASVEKETDKLWVESNAGYLGGEVKKIDGQTIEIEDPTGKIWEVDIANADLDIFSPIHVDEYVKIIGKETSADEFKAFEVHPWIRLQPRRIFIHQESVLPVSPGLFF